MKTYVRKSISMTVLGLALAVQSLPTWAGQVIQPEVQVGTNSASGSMAGARYSSDTQQHITCIIHDAAVSCSARDKTGKYFTCQRSDPRWLSVAKAITDFSLISFNSNGGGTCTSLIVENHASHVK